MDLNIGGNKTLFQIEREINEFLLNDKDFLEIKKSSEYVKGSTKDCINSVIEYINNFINDNIDESIRICPYNFFSHNQHVPIQTIYMLPDGTKEKHIIGTLFAFCNKTDINARIWWESTILYVRFNSEYLYYDAYHFNPSSIYKPLIIDDLHKMFIKESKKRKINKCEKNINMFQHQIEKMMHEMEDEKTKKEKIMKWICQ